MNLRFCQFKIIAKQLHDFCFDIVLLDTLFANPLATKIHLKPVSFPLFFNFFKKWQKKIEVLMAAIFVAKRVAGKSWLVQW